MELDRERARTGKISAETDSERSSGAARIGQLEIDHFE
jgi:hypothetical protein